MHNRTCLSTVAYHALSFVLGVLFGMHACRPLKLTWRIEYVSNLCFQLALWMYSPLRIYRRINASSEEKRTVLFIIEAFSTLTSHESYSDSTFIMVSQAFSSTQHFTYSARSPRA